MYSDHATTPETQTDDPDLKLAANFCSNGNNKHRSLIKIDLYFFEMLKNNRIFCHSKNIVNFQLPVCSCLFPGIGDSIFESDCQDNFQDFLMTRGNFWFYNFEQILRHRFE